jgi:uncharacterized protein YraI
LVNTLPLWLSLLLLLAGFTPLQAQEIVEAQAYRTVNVRSGPGTQYPVISRLDGGDIVSVTGRNDQESNWLLIEQNGLEGWIAYFTVNVTGDLSALPIVDNIEALAPAVSLASAAEADNSSSEPQVTAFRAVNVRSAPSASSSRLGTLQPGNSATITGKTADTEWLRIDFNGQEAWIAYFVVNVSGDLDLLPVIESPETLEPQTAAANQAIEVTTRFNANLRSVPNRNAELVLVVPYNTSVRATARSAAGDWLRVEYNGAAGWLVTSLVTISETTDLSQLPIEPT